MPWYLSPRGQVKSEARFTTRSDTIQESSFSKCYWDQPADLQILDPEPRSL